jgi:hypothetical protein
MDSSLKFEPRPVKNRKGLIMRQTQNSNWPCFVFLSRLICDIVTSFWELSDLLVESITDGLDDDGIDDGRVMASMVMAWTVMVSMVMTSMMMVSIKGSSMMTSMTVVS